MIPGLLLGALLEIPLQCHDSGAVAGCDSRAVSGFIAWIVAGSDALATPLECRHIVIPGLLLGALLGILLECCNSRAVAGCITWLFDGQRWV